MGNPAEVCEGITPKEAGEQWYALRNNLWRDREVGKRSQHGIIVNQMASILLRFQHGPMFDRLLNTCFYEEGQKAAPVKDKDMRDLSLSEQRKVYFEYIAYQIGRHLFVDPSYFQNAGLLQYGEHLL
jgi:hypothetical protein